MCVDELDSAEVWAEHRVGRRPKQVKRDVSETAEMKRVVASHDGYRHIGVTHQRTLQLSQQRSVLKGEDVVTSTYRLAHHRVRAHFHLHPAIKYRLKDEQTAELTLASGRQCLFTVEGGRLYDMESLYCPQFGEQQAAKQLVIQAQWRKGAKIEWQLDVLDVAGK